jgi:hypothetical protein
MKTALRLLLLLCFVAVPMLGAWAQPGPGGPPPCWPPPCIPIDGGLSFLIIAGAMLGGSRAMASRRSRKTVP